MATGKNLNLAVAAELRAIAARLSARGTVADEVLDVLATFPSGLSGNAVQELLGRRGTTVRAAIAECQAAGKIRRQKNVWMLTGDAS